MRTFQDSVSDSRRLAPKRSVGWVREQGFIATVLGALFVWVFAEALLGSGVFIYRDAAHFYYPLFEFVRDEWRAGRPPLWNPYENLGVPLAANATSSVFYPGTLLFLLPVAYPLAYKAYIMGHVLLAAASAYRLARHWQASVLAAGVAALAYAFSGNVLFQYCNVVFLVGAAWLPLAVEAADRMLTRRSLPAAIGLGAVLALITLGGNAELAYHAGLLAALYAAWLWWYERKDRGKATSPMAFAAGSGLAWSLGAGDLLRRRPVLLAAAALAAFLLAAVQVLPSAEFSRVSDRAESTTPRSLWELGGRVADGRATGDWWNSLACRWPEAASHHRHAFHFSVGPWRLAEFLWPNVSGRTFPVHRRWLDVLPAEGRTWAPSLYMGLIPVVLALGAMRFRRATARETWLTWTVVLAVLASFGWYGVGWWWMQIDLWRGGTGTAPVGAPFGGLYWLMTVALPGYVYFRYPAKLLVVAALGLSMLAAIGWDRLHAGEARRFGRVFLAVASVSLAGAIAVWIARPWWEGWLAGAPADPAFGPLDARGAAADVLIAFAQAALVGGLSWWLVPRVARGIPLATASLVVLVALDLGMANRWMVACADEDRLSAPSALASVLANEEIRRGGPDPIRVFRRPYWGLSSWQQTSSTDRVAAMARWQRDSLSAKHHLAPQIGVIEVYGTMIPRDYRTYLGVGKRGVRIAASPGEEQEGHLSDWDEPIPQILYTHAHYAILPGDCRLPGGQRVSSAVPGVSVWHNPRHLPRAWIVHEVEVLSPLKEADPAAARERTHLVFGRSLRDSALVEADPRTWQPLVHVARAEWPRADACRIVRYEPLKIEIEAELARPGLLVLSDQFYPGWHAEVQSPGERPRKTPILQTNRVMRGVWLESGPHRVVFRYCPANFFWGALASGAAWLALCAAGFFAAARNLRRHRLSQRLSSVPIS